MFRLKDIFYLCDCGLSRGMFTCLDDQYMDIQVIGGKPYYTDGSLCTMSRLENWRSGNKCDLYVLTYFASEMDHFLEEHFK